MMGLRQSGAKCGASSQRTFSHCSALSAYFNNFRLKVPCREPYLIVSQQNNVEVHAKNVRLASVTPTLDPSGSKWLFQALTDWLSLSLSGSKPESNTLVSCPTR